MIKFAHKMLGVVNLASVHKGICDVIKTIMYSHIVELPEELQEKVSNRLNDLHKRIDEQDEDVQTLFKGFEEELMEERRLF